MFMHAIIAYACFSVKHYFATKPSAVVFIQLTVFDFHLGDP